jgi:hypothetical protein
MPTLQAWINRRCACVHPDAHECAVIREGRHLRTEPDIGCFGGGFWVAKDVECECVCHDLGEDEDQHAQATRHPDPATR